VEYCPLGKGKVDVPAVLALLEQAPEMKIIMVELDPSRNPPNTPLETRASAKEYLQKAGLRIPDHKSARFFCAAEETCDRD